MTARFKLKDNLIYWSAVKTAALNTIGVKKESKAYIMLQKLSQRLSLMFIVGGARLSTFFLVLHDLGFGVFSMK